MLFTSAEPTTALGRQNIFMCIYNWRKYLFFNWNMAAFNVNATIYRGQSSEKE
jgi:hypothetical protein